MHVIMCSVISHDFIPAFCSRLKKKKKRKKEFEGKLLKNAKLTKKNEL